MVSGLPTASGYEERIRFAEMEVIDRGASEQGLTINVPEGNEINGWDVNIAGVRTTSIKRRMRYHTHAVCSTSYWRFFGTILILSLGIPYSRKATRQT